MLRHRVRCGKPFCFRRSSVTVTLHRLERSLLTTSANEIGTELILILLPPGSQGRNPANRTPRASPLTRRWFSFPVVRRYTLTELHDPEAIELFITEEEARRALEDCLRDEPEWRGRLEVTEVELDHEHTSPS
jgi:hypothetical protein